MPLNPPAGLGYLGHENSLQRTVRRGELLEITVAELLLSEPTFGNPVSNRVSNRICRNPYTLCLEGRWSDFAHLHGEHRCEECLIGHQAFMQHPVLPFRLDRPPIEVTSPRSRKGILVNDEMRVKGVPLENHFIYQCTRELPNQCEEGDWEDQWVEHQIWSLPIGPIVFQEKPLLPAHLASFLDGLSLKFRVSVLGGPALETVCPIRAINPEVLGTHKVLLSLENTEACAPFPVDVPHYQQRSASLSLFNNAFMESEFQCGSQVTNWNGNRTYECIRQSGDRVVRNTTVQADEEARLRGERLGIFEPYFPRIAIQGFIRSVGSTFGSLAPGY